MPWGLLQNYRIATIAVLTAVIALAYMAAVFRIGRRELGVIDCVIMVLLMAIAGGAAMPLLEGASQGAKESAVLQNLYTLRSQIALYKLQHGGEPPVLYESTLPQMLQSTDGAGNLGGPDSQHPFGPYLIPGVPPNPVTGRTVITATPGFPPAAASGNGGWLYCQETGQIAVDLPELLNR